jgi:hypothetical protein
MPIRFRCAYCNQLMGIARRKAGTVVSCPTCQGQVVVPSPEPGLVEPMLVPPPANAASPAPSPSGQEAAALNVFDQQDFDPGLFNPNPVPVTAPAPGPAFLHPGTAPAPAAPRQMPVSAGSEPFALPEPGQRPPRGMVLTSTKLTLLLIGAAVAGLILFGLGLLVGKAIS